MRHPNPSAFNSADSADSARASIVLIKLQQYSVTIAIRIPCYLPHYLPYYLPYYIYHTIYHTICYLVEGGTPRSEFNHPARSTKQLFIYFEILTLTP